jgi:hypothetical protein
VTPRSLGPALDLLTAAERLRALVFPFTQIDSMVQDLAEKAPELLPELRVIDASTAEAAAAAERAITFLMAKLEAEYDL